jgi:hypothetical protein
MSTNIPLRATSLIARNTMHTGDIEEIYGGDTRLFKSTPNPSIKGR